MAISLNRIVWNNWRDNLKEASFRDIPFKILSHTAEGGRRTQLHQFPFNDEPYLEDFGKEAGVYRIEAYICQSSENDYDYFPLRDLLREALEQEGPGTLVHPFLGTLNVGVQGKYQLKESFAEGGVARFTITFVEAGKPQQPAAEIETISLDDKQTSIWDTVGGALQTANEVGFIVNNALQQAQYYCDATTAALLTPISVASSIVQGAMTTVATIKSDIAAVMNSPDQVAALLKQVGDVFKSLATIVSDDNETAAATVTTTGSSPIITDPSLTNACVQVSEFGTPFAAADVTTPDTQVMADNQNLIIDAGRCSAMVEAVRAALAQEYASYEDAETMRQTLVNAFDAVIDGVGSNSQNDTLYQVMADVKQYAVGMMTIKGANLPVLRSITVPADVMPSLNYAQSVYGDLSREAEIVARNPVVMRHPGFPLGGQELKVLSE